MKKYAEKVTVSAYQNGKWTITESKAIVKIALKMWAKSCDIFNDDPGLIDTLNSIWNIRHPNENPNDSKELNNEYRRLHDRMCDDIWRALSWTDGVDLDNGIRYELLNTPWYDEIIGWRFSITIHDL